MALATEATPILELPTAFYIAGRLPRRDAEQEGHCKRKLQRLPDSNRRLAKITKAYSRFRDILSDLKVQPPNSLRQFESQQTFQFLLDTLIRKS